MAIENRDTEMVPRRSARLQKKYLKAEQEGKLQIKKKRAPAGATFLGGKLVTVKCQMLL